MDEGKLVGGSPQDRRRPPERTDEYFDVNGDGAATVLDERFVAAFAIGGTVRECREQMARYRAAGVDEPALTLAGVMSADDIGDLRRALS